MSRPPEILLSSNMTVRRSFGMLALLAMMQLIVAGTAWACVVARSGAATAQAKHSDCAPKSSHDKEGTTSGTTALPCCTAHASCATAALAARTLGIGLHPPSMTTVVTTAERAPRAESPAPELPPPRA